MLFFPKDYLEVNDSMLNSLMMRHRTLSDTNQNLVDNLDDMANAVSFLKKCSKYIVGVHISF